MYQKAKFNNRGTKIRENTAISPAAQQLGKGSFFPWEVKALGYQWNSKDAFYSSGSGKWKMSASAVLRSKKATVEVKPAKTLAPITPKAEPTMSELKTVLMAILAKM